jgi:hypothetical protein
MAQRMTNIDVLAPEPAGLRYDCEEVTKCHRRSHPQVDEV